MDLPMVEKPIAAILMNSSMDNIKSSRHVKRRLKSDKKMRKSGVIALSYI
jgi:hypothetical protein